MHFFLQPCTTLTTSGSWWPSLGTKEVQVGSGEWEVGNHSLSALSLSLHDASDMHRRDDDDGEAARSSELDGCYGQRRTGENDE